MASASQSRNDRESGLGPEVPLGITEFSIENLFGAFDYVIPIPDVTRDRSVPGVLILSGQNGSGKTTILKMIDGMLKMDFDEFRRVPFRKARLSFSNGEDLTVERRNHESFPLIVEYKSSKAVLGISRDSANYTPQQIAHIDSFRAIAGPDFSSVKFDLILVDRAYREVQEEEIGYDQYGRRIANEGRQELSRRVRGFMREAQLNYRKFFEAEELDVLPKLIRRLEKSDRSESREELVSRASKIRAQFPAMKRFGLHTDDADIASIEKVLSEASDNNAQAISLISTYVEVQETKNSARNLIAQRLIEFESIMDEFMIGKKIRLDARNGIRIESEIGTIKEGDLSSGEYHFLYMMVSALLCQSSGSIIAIDEPELSLHVKWQRKLVSALTKCAARASPLFVLATHSVAIAAEHKSSVREISSVD